MCKGPVVPARNCQVTGVARAGGDGESNTGPAHTGKAEPYPAPPHPLPLAHSYSSFSAQLRNFPSRKPLCSMQAERPVTFSYRKKCPKLRRWCFLSLPLFKRPIKGLVNSVGNTSEFNFGILYLHHVLSFPEITS